MVSRVGNQCDRHRGGRILKPDDLKMPSILKKRSKVSAITIAVLMMKSAANAYFASYQDLATARVLGSFIWPYPASRWLRLLPPAIRYLLRDVAIAIWHRARLLRKRKIA